MEERGQTPIKSSILPFKEVAPRAAGGTYLKHFRMPAFRSATKPGDRQQKHLLEHIKMQLLLGLSWSRRHKSLSGQTLPGQPQPPESSPEIRGGEEITGQRPEKPWAQL